MSASVRALHQVFVSMYVHPSVHVCVSNGIFKDQQLPGNFWQMFRLCLLSFILQIQTPLCVSEVYVVSKKVAKEVSVSSFRENQ